MKKPSVVLSILMIFASSILFSQELGIERSSSHIDRLFEGFDVSELPSFLLDDWYPTQDGVEFGYRDFYLLVDPTLVPQFDARKLRLDKHLGVQIGLTIGGAAAVAGGLALVFVPIAETGFANLDPAPLIAGSAIGGIGVLLASLPWLFRFNEPRALDYEQAAVLADRYNANN